MPRERLYFVNGLPSLYETLEKQDKGKGKAIIEKFLIDSFKSDLPDKVKRFLDAGIPGLIPADMEYFRLYHELLQIYLNGLFYSTIVLAGVLCERICFDILSAQKITLDGRQLTEEEISCLYEMNFNKVVDLLCTWGLIERDTKNEMHKIYDKRNQYTHPKMKAINPEKDSIDVLKRVKKIIIDEIVNKPERTL
jgi:hypothetical protein